MDFDLTSSMYICLYVFIIKHNGFEEHVSSLEKTLMISSCYCCCCIFFQPSIPSIFNGSSSPVIFLEKEGKTVLMFCIDFLRLGIVIIITVTVYLAMYEILVSFLHTNQSRCCCCCCYCRQHVLCYYYIHFSLFLYFLSCLLSLCRSKRSFWW